MSVSVFGLITLAISTSFFLLALVAIGLRIWAFHLRARPWKIYDTLIVVSTIFQTGLVVALFYAVLYGGLGRHIDQVSEASVMSFFKSFAGLSVSWVLTTTIVKLSILFFYLDIFRFNRKTRWWLYGFIGFVAAYGIASMLCVFTICRPFPKMWDRSQEGKCGNIMAAMFATAVINCVEDFLVVVIPLPVIWQLQMSRRKKLGLSALIGIGFVDDDPTYMLAYQSLFINLEVHLGLINACLPMIKSLFKKPQEYKSSSSAYSGPSEFKKQSNHSGYTAGSGGGTFDKMPRHLESFDTETELTSCPERTRSF